MDTTETLNGTYFYHGHANVTKEELFWLIFIESFADHSGMAVETAATIIAGQPILPKRKVLGAKGNKTSIASKMARRIFNNARFLTECVLNHWYWARYAIRTKSVLSSAAQFLILVTLRQ